MEITFEGTGIDVRCIIANNETPSASIPAFTGTKANYSFFIDSVPQNQDYVHEAGTTGDTFLYNTSVFSTNTLSTGPHTLKLLLNGGPDVNGSVLLLFDYAIVTSDDATGDEPGPSAGQSASPTQSTTANPSPSSSISPPSAHKSNLGAIVGGLVGGLTLVLLLLCFWLCRKRKRAHPPRIPRRLQFPHSLSHTNQPSSTSREMTTIVPLSSSHDKPSISPPAPSASASSSATTNVESRVVDNSAMRDYVQRLRAEVALLREQQQEMVAMQRVPSPEPPPRYEDI